VSLFDSPDPVFPATPDLSECAPMQAFEGVLFENEPAFSSGESQLFERPLADGGTVRVSLLTVTFSNASAAEAILTSARGALGGPGFAPCMLAAAARDGIEATAAEGAALPVPAGGVSRVLRYTASAASGGGTVTQAVGWGGEGERLVALTISAAGEAPKMLNWPGSHRPRRGASNEAIAGGGQRPDGGGAARGLDPAEPGQAGAGGTGSSAIDSHHTGVGPSIWAGAVVQRGAFGERVVQRREFGVRFLSSRPGLWLGKHVWRKPDR